MNVFGIGGPELIAILIIMLVFAGPKRMIHWSYILGQYLAKFRVLWSQTVDVIQKEFDDAGVDIKLPKEPPTRKNLNKSISEAFQPVTQPLQDTLSEVQKDVDSIKAVSTDLKKTTSANSKPDNEPQTELPAKPSSTKKDDLTMGTWSNQGQQSTTEGQSQNGKQVDLGTWSSPSADK